MLLFGELLLLQGREVNTIVFGDGDSGFLLRVTNDEDVSDSGREGLTVGISDMGDVERTGVLVDVGEDTDTANIVTRLNIGSGAQFEEEDFGNFIFLQVQF